MTLETVEVPDGVALKSKLLAMLFLGASSMISGSVPVCIFNRMIRGSGRSRVNGSLVDGILRVVLNFGGGVLLCTTFLHLLPEVREGVEQLAEYGLLNPELHTTGLLAEIIMCVGFFLIYSIEELVHTFAHNHHHGHSLEDIDTGNRGVSNHGFEKDNENTSTISNSGKMINYNSFTHTSNHTEKTIITESKEGASIYRGLLIVGALTIHELFEGLAVGLEKNPTQVWSLTIAVACHKIVIAFYVGLQIISDKTKPWLAHCMVLVFAIASPIGIGFGAIVSNLDETAGVVIMSVSLQGLATGTLTYVVFFEVLKPSPKHLQIGPRLVKLISIAFGFFIMMCVQLNLSD
ncbi:zinc transporter ZIP3-like [Daktulosphaira vitifoliae]|uniref:zinc transporter ZIP3-like n=1 Tax=Daktulosphaira vitifoliae TaxID=58002 RepID=UPI0021AB02EF|nr:zinc transporter ZIP3-like [Daktulosphaira vitifoliae]